MSSEKNKFIAQLHSSFPNLQKTDLENAVSDNLISPFAIRLTPAIVKQVHEVVGDLFSMRDSKPYLEHFQGLIQEKG